MYIKPVELESIMMERSVFLKKLSRCILFAVLPAAVFYGSALLGLKSHGMETMEILRDPAQESECSSFLGFLSNIGIWLWVSSAAISFFSAFLRNAGALRQQKELLFLTGLLSGILAIDDFFLIHDRYIDQNICYLAYAICTGALLIRHYKIIFEINGSSFLLAGMLLALSVFSDLVQE